MGSQTSCSAMSTHLDVYPTRLDDAEATILLTSFTMTKIPTYKLTLMKDFWLTVCFFPIVPIRTSELTLLECRPPL